MPALRLLNALGRRVSGVRRKLSAERPLRVNVKRKGMRVRRGWRKRIRSCDESIEDTEAEFGGMGMPEKNVANDDQGRSITPG